MHFDLDAMASEVVAARMETDRRLQLEGEKFERFAARRRGRLERERSANRTRLHMVLSRSLGVTVPKDAEIGLKADGFGVVEWPDHAPAPAAAAIKVLKNHDDTVTTPAPTNGELVGVAP